MTTSGSADSERAAILLVDDRRENLRALEALLTGPGYELVLASSGDEALAALLKHDFAVILLDAWMPGLDGFQTASLIRQRPAARHIPIIFVTASAADAEHVFRAYQEGAVDYLTKPFEPFAVRAKVAAFAELWRHRRTVEQTAAALHEAERRERITLEALYQVTFEEAPIGLGHASLDGRWLRVNCCLGRILGRPAAELLGRPLRAELVPADRDRFDADVCKLIDGKVARLRGEYRLLRADGATIWCALTLSLIRNTKGEPVQLTFLEDVTEEKRAAETLAASERRFMQLADMGFIGIFEESRDGTIEEANTALLDMVGYSADDLRARKLNARDLTPAEYGQVDRGAWEALTTTGMCRTYEKEFIHKDGHRVTALVSGVASEGKFIACALDVTPLKDVSRERARVVRELQDSLRTRDDFLSLAAQELSGPLTPLNLRLTRLLRMAEKPEVPIEASALAREVGPMRRATARLTEIVDNLLELSRMTVGRISLNVGEVDLCATVREVLDRMRPEIERAGCDIDLTAEASVVGHWDRARLEQVVTNLVSNAIKYGANASVEIAISASSDTAHFSIHDHGIGILPADHERIFERFERLAPVGSRHAGFGVGLWIVRRLVEAHGGSVHVESQPGEGARFFFDLPRKHVTAHPSHVIIEAARA